MTSPRRGNIFALLMVAFSILFIILSSIGAAILIANEKIGVENANIILIIIQDFFIILLPIILYCAVTQTKPATIIPHERLSLKNIGYTIILTILVSPIIYVVSSVTTLFYSAEENNAVIMGYINGLPMLLCVFALAVMPAVFEELAFRGIILSNYKSIGFVKSAVVSGFLFGLFHMDLYQMGYAIIAGIFFAFLVRCTNSIYTSMLSHFIINGSQVIISKAILLLGYSFEPAAPTPSDIYASIAMGIFFTVITTPFLITWVKRFMQYNNIHRLDYDLSIGQTDSSEFKIPIEATEHKKTDFVDIYFIAYVALIAILTILTKLAGNIE